METWIGSQWDETNTDDKVEIGKESTSVLISLLSPRVINPGVCASSGFPAIQDLKRHFLSQIFLLLAVKTPWLICYLYTNDNLYQLGITVSCKEQKPEWQWLKHIRGLVFLMKYDIWRWTVLADTGWLYSRLLLSFCSAFFNMYLSPYFQKLAASVSQSGRTKRKGKQQKINATLLNSFSQSISKLLYTFYWP